MNETLSRDALDKIRAKLREPAPAEGDNPPPSVEERMKVWGAVWQAASRRVHSGAADKEDFALLALADDRLKAIQGPQEALRREGFDGCVARLIEHCQAIHPHHAAALSEILETFLEGKS